ncbi:MAG: TetR/AcrR family transcriptional regulator [Clostridia bacterium]|nr:TetR/AcrR family transcriptional regulator [Clostridia bacterium]
MKGEQIIKETLINNAISVVAEGGFAKATTKALTYSGEIQPGIKMNEIYIYRLFGSKESVYEAAFETLDREFLDALRADIRQIGGFDDDVKSALYKLFLKVWTFVLRNESRCRYYIRYYYSVYFRGSSMDTHNAHFRDIIEDFVPLFKAEADVKSIMHSVFTTLLDFAVRVYNGDLEDSEESRPHVFNVIYCTMSSYFKDAYRDN